MGSTYCFDTYTFPLVSKVIRVFAGFRDDQGVSRIGFVDVDAFNQIKYWAYQTNQFSAQVRRAVSMTMVSFLAMLFVMKIRFSCITLAFN